MVMTNYMDLLAANQPWNLILFMVIPVVLAESLVATEFYTTYYGGRAAGWKAWNHRLGIPWQGLFCPGGAAPSGECDPRDPLEGLGGSAGYRGLPFGHLPPEKLICSYGTGNHWEASHGPAADLAPFRSFDRVLGGEPRGHGVRHGGSHHYRLAAHAAQMHQMDGMHHM